MPGLADYLLKSKEGQINQYGLSAQGPLRQGGLYRLSSRPRESFIPESVPNQPPPVQGLVPAQNKAGINAADLQNAFSTIQSLSGKSSAIPQEGVMPGQPQYPGSHVAVNMPSDGRTGMAKAETPLMDYWGKPVAGKMPLDQFVTLAGMAANAFAPNTPQGRLGGGLARMAGNVYGERMNREYEAPDVALRRAIGEERLKKLRGPEMASYTEIDPETGMSITKTVPKSEMPSSYISGIPTTKGYKKPDKQMLWEYRKGLSGSELDEFDKFLGIGKKGDKTPTKLKLWEARNKLPSGQRKEFDRLVFGSKTGGQSKPSFFQQENYRLLADKAARLQELLNTPDDMGNLPSGKAATQIQGQIDDTLLKMDKMQQYWLNSQGDNAAGGMSRAGYDQSIDEQAYTQAIQQAIDAGIPEEQVLNYFSSPSATVEGFAQQFNLNKQKAGPSKQGEAVAAEIPNMKNEPIKTAPKETATTKGMQRQKVPYRTSMPMPATETQKAAAMQELTDLAHKLGVGPENWQALGKLTKDMGGWAWDTYQNAIGALIQGQEESRKQLPAYR